MLIRYSTLQELQADRCAVSVLEAYGKSPAVLGSMLRKVLAYGELMGNYYLGSTKGFFPDAALQGSATFRYNNLFLNGIRETDRSGYLIQRFQGL